jgi:CRISPR system Cascade subunit CasA
MMDEKDISFNLVDKPWVPCVSLDGEYRPLSLKDVFDHAHELRGFAAEHPLTIPALMGILHCIIYRAIDGPKDVRQWAALLNAGKFGPEIQAYIKKWHPRFDLFSVRTPFYQTTGLTTLANGKPSGGVPITTIVQQLSSGNNKTVFDHTFDSDGHTSTPEESALALITIQNAGLRGTNKKTTNVFGYQESFSDAQLVNGSVLLLKGHTLYETIILNLLPRTGNSPIPNSPIDCPVWELSSDAPPQSGNTSIRGYLHLLTPLCRHIRLIPEIDGGEVVVKRIHIAQGEAFRVKDPRFAYSTLKEEGRYSLPRKMQSSRAIWRDSEALFGFGDNRPGPFVNIADAMNFEVIRRDSFKKYVCTAHGMMTKNAKISDWRTDHLQVPASVFVDTRAVHALLEGVGLAEDVAKHIAEAIKKAAIVILPKAKDDRKNLVKHMSENSRTFYWQELDLPFQDFLLSLPDDGSTLRKWFKIVRQHAENALTFEFKTMSYDLSRHGQAWVVAETKLASLLNKTGKNKGVI